MCVYAGDPSGGRSVDLGRRGVVQRLMKTDPVIKIKILLNPSVISVTVS